MAPRRFSVHYTIRTALLAFVLVPFLAVVLIAGGYGLRQLEKRAAEDMEEDIALIARAIRLPLSHALENDQMDMIRSTLSSTQDFNRVYGVHIYDGNGNRLASRGAKTSSVQDDKAAELASIGDELSEFDETASEPVFSYFVPLTNSGGRIIGLLQVTRRGKDFSRYLAEFRSRALPLLGLSALLLITAVYVGYHWGIGRHIRGMRQRMARIAAGGRHERLATDGPAELRVLAEGVNTMLDALLASEKELGERREEEFRLKSELYQAEKLAAIGRLAAGVAHELGTPLSVADGQAQRALRRAGPAEADALQKIRQQLARMTHIIRQLMNFARPSRPELREFDVAELVQASVSQVEPQRGAATIEIRESNCPRIRGDRLRLEQALTNLLRNAIQAAPAGTIQVTCEAEDDWLRITVDDSGPGITPDARKRLFEPFFTTKKTGEGVGLGLAVVEAVVSEHRGWVTCEPSPLGGARFQLGLPLNLQIGRENHRLTND